MNYILSSLKLCKIHKETPAPESLFNKVADLQFATLLTYEHQENESEPKRKRFVQEIKTQIINAIISNTPVLWMHDLDGRLKIFKR